MPIPDPEEAVIFNAVLWYLVNLFGLEKDMFGIAHSRNGGLMLLVYICH